MILQSVTGVKHGEFPHQPVPRDFGDDGSRRDGRAKRVAVDDGPFLSGKTGLLVTVHEAKLGRKRKPLDRAAHGQKAGLQNIVQFDFLDRGDANAPLDLCVTAQKIIQLVPMRGGQDFGVVEMLVREAIGNDRRRRHDRPGPTSAPHFINPGHRDEAGRA